MSNSELQEEELEVLRSIYDGDENFKEITSTSFQYKVGSDGDPKSFLLGIKWSENYPDEQPIFHLDAFYNKHIITNIKQLILDSMQKEAEQYLASAMTYTLIEWAKENVKNLMIDQPDDSKPEELDDAVEEVTVLIEQKTLSTKPEKKAQLSKAQKRKLYDRLDNKGEKPRGWDWVDIVKHLSQSGSKMPTANSVDS